MRNKYFKLAMLLPVGISMVACIGNNAGSSGSSSTGSPASPAPVSAAAKASTVASPTAITEASANTDTSVGGHTTIDSTSTNTILADSLSANPTKADSLTVNTTADGATTDTDIGVISWNVKGFLKDNTNGGWNVAANRNREINEIQGQINPQIDFIAISQTNEKYNGSTTTPTSNVTKLDMQLNSMQHVTKWSGIYSECGYDGTQIIFDNTKWAKMIPAADTNPSLGFAKCVGVGSIPQEDDRPYSIALFRNIESGHNNDKKVLFINVHLPHGTPNPSVWIALNTFSNTVKTIISQNGGSGNIRVIMVGDMNDVGDNYSNPTFSGFFTNLFGKGMWSDNKQTCCSNNGWAGKYDKLYATNSQINAGETQILDITPYNIIEQHRGIRVLVGHN